MQRCRCYTQTGTTRPGFLITSLWLGGPSFWTPYRLCWRVNVGNRVLKCIYLCCSVFSLCIKLLYQKSKKSLHEWQCVLSSEWRTHNDLYMGVWPHFFDWIAGVAIYAGAWAIDHRNGDVAVNQANSLQHGPLCPAIRNGHVFKGCFTAKILWSW